MTEYVALTLNDRTSNGSKFKQGLMTRTDEGQIMVTVSKIPVHGDTRYAVSAVRIPNGDPYSAVSLGRVGTVRKERIGVYHVSSYKADGTPNYDGYSDNFTLAYACEVVVAQFLSNLAFAEKKAQQAIVAADPTHVHEYGQYNVCDGCGARKISKQQQIQTLRLKVLPYEATADSSLVKTRGEKCAVMCKGLVGFYFPSEVGDMLVSLVEVGLDVTVLAPTTVEIN